MPPTLLRRQRPCHSVIDWVIQLGSTSKPAFSSTAPIVLACVLDFVVLASQRRRIFWTSVCVPPWVAWPPSNETAIANWAGQLLGSHSPPPCSRYWTSHPRSP